MILTEIILPINIELRLTASRDFHEAEKIKFVTVAAQPTVGICNRYASCPAPPPRLRLTNLTKKF